MPTELNWKDKGIKIVQDCLWPAESTKIRIVEGKAKFTMHLRIPYWATEGFKVKVNGAPLPPGGGYEVAGGTLIIPPSGGQGGWKKGDIVEIEMPFTKHINYGPDKLSAEVASAYGTPLDDAWVGTLMYGPLAMTGTDAITWDDATLSIDSRLDNIKANKPNGPVEGKDGNLYTLTVD